LLVRTRTGKRIGHLDLAESGALRLLPR